MKSKKIIVASLLCLVPFGLLADGHGKDDDRRGCSDKEFSLKNDFIKNKGVNLIFEGKVQSQPKSGFNGTWKISGMDIIVDDNTIVLMEKEEGSFFKGKDKEVSILAKRENGKIKAIKIKVD